MPFILFPYGKRFTDVFQLFSDPSILFRLDPRSVRFPDFGRSASLHGPFRCHRFILEAAGNGNPVITLWIVTCAKQVDGQRIIPDDNKAFQQ